MSGRHRVVLALCLALGAVTVVALWQPGPKGRQQSVVDSEKVHTDPKTGEKYRIVGGVRRSLHEVRGRKSEPNQQQGDDRDFESLVGRTPEIPKDANAMVRSMVEAIETKSHPERLSVLLTPKPFDKKAYESNPAAYLNVVEPGRVFQPAEPGPGVPRLQMASKPYQQVNQKETVTLKVMAVPKAPVTFTSFDLGEFQNRLTSITVEADAEGTAIARYTGTPGTYGPVNILAASPLTSGKAKFELNVIVPGFNTPTTAAVTSKTN